MDNSNSDDIVGGRQYGVKRKSNLPFITPAPKMEHQLVRLSDGTYWCAGCRCLWKQSISVSKCPQVACYDWDTAPFHLQTVLQLRRQHREPTAPPRGCIWSWKERANPIWLYALGETAPSTPLTPVQQASLEGMRAAWRNRAREGTCQGCGLFGSVMTYTEEGNRYCALCLQAAVELQLLKERQRAINQARTFERLWYRDAMALVVSRGMRAVGMRAVRWNIWDIWGIDDIDDAPMWIDQKREGLDIVIVDGRGVLRTKRRIEWYPLSAPQHELDAWRQQGGEKRLLKQLRYVSQQFKELVKPGALAIDSLFSREVLNAYATEFQHAGMVEVARILTELASSIQPRVVASTLYAKYCGDWDEDCAEYRLQNLPGRVDTTSYVCRAVLRATYEMAMTPNCHYSMRKPSLDRPLNSTTDVTHEDGDVYPR